MYLWKRSAGAKWLRTHGFILGALAGPRLVMIARPGGRQIQLEIASPSRQSLQQFKRRFGGRITKLPVDWLKRAIRQQIEVKPLKIGKRLVIANAKGSPTASRAREHNGATLVVPAGAAFGTGRHATTAMCLRMLERLLRKAGSGSSKKRTRATVIDLGTGSGILALAARSLGAEAVLGIDSDPAAISTARQNLTLNRLGRVQFRLGDVLALPLPRRASIVTANLFSEILLQLLPRLRGRPWLILSGVLRKQEDELLRAIRRQGFRIAEVRRRGKWTAILAKT